MSPDYPPEALDVKLLIESDDADTLAAALHAVHASNIDVLIIPASAPRTKPKALNAGLALARGEYVAIYDAEDRPHPQQLRAALAAFEDGDEKLACVQAPLVIDNAGAAWIARQFAAEYAIQFNEILPLLAMLKLPLPLGGSSNHFRTDILRLSGGWDPNNVREKCIAFAAQNQRFARAALFESRSALISVSNCKKCAIGLHREAVRVTSARRACGLRPNFGPCARA
ncbi:MAG: glycosyltransferase [Proteobacteria bacterium]|nr:glycosyltransferase [Pseudomonadota bacterium]